MNKFVTYVCLCVCAITGIKIPVCVNSLFSRMSTCLRRSVPCWFLNMPEGRQSATHSSGILPPVSAFSAVIQTPLTPTHTPHNVHSSASNGQPLPFHFCQILSLTPFLKLLEGSGDLCTNHLKLRRHGARGRRREGEGAWVRVAGGSETQSVKKKKEKKESFHSSLFF